MKLFRREQTQLEAINARVDELRREERALKDLRCKCGHWAWIHTTDGRGCLSMFTPDGKESDCRCSCTEFDQEGE